LFILFVIQTILGRYQDKANEAWAWFLPTVMPKLLLMIGAFAADATNPQDVDAKIRAFIFFLSFGISLLYLTAVALTTVRITVNTLARMPVRISRIGVG